MRRFKGYLTAFCIIFLTASVTPLIAQPGNEEETPWQFTYGADIVSRFVWRGLEMGDKPKVPHIQPGLNLDYSTKKPGTFSIWFFASYGIAGCYFETDFGLNYQIETKIGTLGIGLTDYYYPYQKMHFFNFDGYGEGAHTLEGQFIYSCVESFPLQLIVASNLHNDLPGDNSLYFEISYPFDAANFSFNIFAGAAKGVSIYYDIDKQNFHFINTGASVVREINFSDKFVLPFGIDFIYNPFLNKGFLVFRISYFSTKGF